MDVLEPTPGTAVTVEVSRDLATHLWFAGVLTGYHLDADGEWLARVRWSAGERGDVRTDWFAADHVRVDSDRPLLFRTLDHPYPVQGDPLAPRSPDGTLPDLVAPEDDCVTVVLLPPERFAGVQVLLDGDWTPGVLTGYRVDEQGTQTCCVLVGAGDGRDAVTLQVPRERMRPTPPAQRQPADAGLA